MALTEVKTFTLRLGTGTQNVALADGSFKPSALLFFSDDQTNFANRAFEAFGFSDGVNNFGTAIAIGGFGTEHFWGDDHCIVGGVTASSFELRLAARVTALNAGSFDLQFDTNAVGGQTWTYVAFNSATISASAFRVDVSGLFPRSQSFSFQPQIAIGQWHSGAHGGTFFASGGDGAATFGWGSSCQPDKQICLANALYKTYQHQGKFLTRINAGGSIDQEIQITGWGVSSVTFDVSVFPNGEYFSVLVLGGATFSSNTGVFVQGDTPIPILAGSPACILVGSFCNVASAGIVNGFRVAFGACDGTRQSSICVAATDNNVAGEDVSTTKLVILSHPDGTPHTSFDGQAAWTAFGAQAVTLTWNIDDGVDRQCFYLVLATDPGTGPDFCGGVAVCGPGVPSIPGNPVSPIIGGTPETGSAGAIVQ